MRSVICVSITVLDKLYTFTINILRKVDYMTKAKKDILYNNFLSNEEWIFVSDITSKKKMAWCCCWSYELRGEAGFNIYMCIKHEHSIIILLSYLLWALRAWSFWIYMNIILYKDNGLKMASSEWRHLEFLLLISSFMILYNLYFSAMYFTYNR